MTRKLVLVFLMVLFSRHISGQELHYLYIQSGDHASFYVKTGLKTYESSGSGYLVIEGLVASSYNLVIGYKNNPLPEWSFSVAVDNKDLAFTLTKKGGIPYLTAMGNSHDLAGSRVEATEIKDVVKKKEALNGPVSDDAFSRLLADVVDDPTIRLKPVIIAKEEPVAVQPVSNNTVESPMTTGTTAPPSGTELPASVKESLAVSQKTTEKPPAITPPPVEESKSLAAATKTDSAVTVFRPDTAAAITQNNSGLPAENRSTEKKEPEASLAIIEKQADKPPVTNADTARAVAAAAVTVPDTASARAEEHTNAGTEASTAAREEKIPAAKEKIPASSVSNVTVKDVTEEPEIKEESRPFVLNEVVKNIKKGRKKNEPEAASQPRFPVSVSIKKTLEKQSADGTELIYVDEVSPGNKETIRILIPAN